MINLVAQVLANPHAITNFSLADWDLLIRQGRSSDLLARLHGTLTRHQLLDHVPNKARDHLQAAHTQAQRHQQLVHYEIDQIYKALLPLETPVVLLKGAAYVAAGLPAAEGRVFTDIDILVHKTRIDLAEDALEYQGWVSSKLDPYDQRYYRQWMHEIPPMEHSTRKTLLDVHHAILPETARLQPDTNKLLKAAIPLPGYEFLYILCPEDMVLHSAVHLFSDGEFEHGLRDLADIDALLRHFPKQNDKFWERLVGRARNQDLKQPLFYALRYCKEILQTPIPETTMEAARVQAQVSGPASSLVDTLLKIGLAPNHPSCHHPLRGFALWLLYVRSHYLRMPFRLLIPHLFHKAVISPYDEFKRDREQAKQPTIQQLLEKPKR